ncbi:MAG: GNAT family N-acetyltransferase, partial [Deltaproteobacteria bacterium]|nr:GNAT family N-acetyltransferase [Deltaproteobacteria bacterium]
EMEIRPLIDSDRDEICRILGEVAVFNAQEIWVAIELIDEVLGHPDGEEYYIFCSLNKGNQITGYVTIGPIPLTDGCYDLYWIAVDNKYRGRGVGGELLAWSENYAMSKGARRIYVDTSSTPAYDPARLFYEKHGYRVECLLKDFYRLGDHKIVYSKDLPLATPEKKGRQKPTATLVVSR